MRIEPGSGPNRCRCCMRKKEEALRDHIKTMQNCDNPDCPFYDYINEAIEAEKEKFKFKFGEKTKSKFSFGQKK